MGQRAIGLVEQSSGKYNAFYIHWFPDGNVSEEKMTKDYLIGEKDPLERNIEKSEATTIATDHGAEIIFVIDINGELNFIN
jgi:hypothetical protein